MHEKGAQILTATVVFSIPLCNEVFVILKTALFPKNRPLKNLLKHIQQELLFDTNLTNAPKFPML